MRELWQPIHFHQTYTYRVVFAGDDRGKSSRWEIGDDRRFQVVCRWDASSYDFCLLAASIGSGFPIIIAAEQPTVSIAQLQRGIRQRTVDSGLPQRRPDGAHDHVHVPGPPAQDETTDHHIAPGLDETTGADVRQSRVGRLVQIVDFDHADTGPSIFPAHDHRVSGVVRRQRPDNGGLQIVGWRNGGRFNLSLLAAAVRVNFPVVIRRQRRAGVMQFQDGIGQRFLNTCVGQRRPNGANDYAFRNAASDDQPADHDIFACLHPQPGGNVKRLGRGRWRRADIDRPIHSHRIMRDAVVVEFPGIWKGEGKLIPLGPQARIEHSVWNGIFAAGVAGGHRMVRGVPNPGHGVSRLDGNGAGLELVHATRRHRHRDGRGQSVPARDDRDDGCDSEAAQVCPQAGLRARGMILWVWDGFHRFCLLVGFSRFCSSRGPTMLNPVYGTFLPTRSESP